MVATPNRTLGDLALFGVEPDTGVEWSVQGPDSSDWWNGGGSTVSLRQRPRGHGAWAGDAFLPANHYVISGLVSAPSQTAMRDALDRLHAAASLSDTTMTVTEESVTRWAMVRREDVVLVKMLHPTLARFSVQLLAVDPRKFGDALAASTALPSTTGGLTFPHTFPHTFDAVTITGQVSLTNPGNIAGPVRLRISGPVTAPVITHVSSGRSLVFASSVVLAAGEWIDVDMERRTVLANGQASRNGWVTQRGWSQFEPGNNVWAFTAGTYNAGSQLTVTATPSWM